MIENSELRNFYKKNAREIVQRGTLSAAMGSLGVTALLMMIHWHYNHLTSIVTLCGVTLLVGNTLRLFNYFNHTISDEAWFGRLKISNFMVMFSFCGIFTSSYFEKSNTTLVISSYLVVNALVSATVFWQFLVKQEMILSTTVYLVTAEIGLFIWSDDLVFQFYGSALIVTYFGFLIKQGFLKRDEWYKHKKDEFELRMVVRELPSTLFQETGFNVERSENNVFDSTKFSISDLQNEILKQLKNTLAENEKKTADLARADKMASIGEMLSGIMHEINNPISIITSRIQLISNVFQSENVDMNVIKKSFDVISRNAYRTSKIIAGVKTLFRETSIESFVNSELGEIIQNTNEAVSEKIKKHDVSIEFFFKNCSSNTKLFCFPLQISQVLINLINNSCDAIKTANSKWINVKFELFESHFRIDVTDSGVGLTEEIQKKIELPFYTSKKAGEGSGIGLHISKKIIESHRGRFYCNSASKNTEFVIELPLKISA